MTSDPRPGAADGGPRPFSGRFARPMLIVLVGSLLRLLLFASGVAGFPAVADRFTPFVEALTAIGLIWLVAVAMGLVLDLFDGSDGREGKDDGR